MDYKKKYEDAMNRAKKVNNGELTIKSDEVNDFNVYEYIFPELKESEDERIRKMLIRIYKKADMGGEIFGEGITYKQVIAWLEKQGSEPNWCHHNVDLSNCSEEYRKAYYDGWNNCNQQHEQLKAEQKPAWSEEDEKMLDSIIDCIDGLCFIDSDQLNWLKSFKPNHWKPTEEQLNSLGRFIEGVYGCVDFQNIKSLYNDLKSL